MFLIQFLREKLNERFASEENIGILFPKREKSFIGAQISCRMTICEEGWATGHGGKGGALGWFSFSR